MCRQIYQNQPISLHDMIRLICMDMFGVLVRRQEFWEDLRKAYDAKEPPPSEKWIGNPAQPYLDLVRKAEFMPGIDELFSEFDSFVAGHDYFQHKKTVSRAIITGGPYELADDIRKRYNADFVFANRPVFKNHRIAGFQWPMEPGKGWVIEQLCDDLDILPQETLYIGDDTEILRICGIGIALDANDEARNAATYAAPDLHALLPLLDQVREQAA